MIKPHSTIVIQLYRVSKENHWSPTSIWRTFSYNIISSTHCHRVGIKRTTLVVIGTDWIDRCKPNYHMINVPTSRIVAIDVPVFNESLKIWNFGLLVLVNLQHIPISLASFSVRFRPVLLTSTSESMEESVLSSRVSSATCKI